MTMNAQTVAILLKELTRLANSCIPFDEFLNMMDTYNRNAISPLTERLGSERHAKAVLLKLSNIAVAKYQYFRRHSRLISRPFGLIVEPCNSCQLACPGCIHRKSGTDKNNIDWVEGLLEHDTLSRLLNAFGPYAIATQYYNWGEPLLNRKTPEYIRSARRFLMRTSISTNLSVPFDADALVASGLDFLVLSIDGATAKTYQKYRVGGNFDLVLYNIERLVESRRKLHFMTPFIMWRYLLFDHTIEEMEQAEALALKLGVDCINYAQPYDVSLYDAKITKPVNVPVRNHVFNIPVGAGRWSMSNAVSNLHPIIDDHWEKTWLSRMDQKCADISNAQSCQWLYMNMVMDALGRVMPCCFEPHKDPTSIFGDIYASDDPFNSIKYVKSRIYLTTLGMEDPGTECSICPHKESKPNINCNHIELYFSYVDLYT